MLKEGKAVYKAFGLRMLSEIHFPELPPIRFLDGKVDVELEIEDLSELWLENSTSNERFIVKENFVMFRISETAIYCVRDGKKISFYPMEGANIDRIRLYILGTCMGIVLIQKKILPLHGSAIAIDGKAYAIVGDSGAGKSTLAAEFLARGYQLLSDDVIPVIYSQDQQFPLVLPAYPQQKLWQDSLIQLGMEAKHYQPIYDRETKFAIPVSSNFATKSLPLAGVFELVKTDVEEIDFQPIYKLERMQTLFYHTYRNFLFERLELMKWHFDTSLKIANQIGVYRLNRPLNHFTASKLASLILEKLEMEGKKDVEKTPYIIK